ncbi:MAG: peroxiredoxin [Acidimicrobiales bacterium]
MTQLKPGDPAPDISLPDQHGEQVNLTDLRGRWVVVYFYPADDTPGCTAESCSFRDSYEDFTEAGAEVLGISSDSVESHLRFAEKHRLPFRLLADVDGRARDAFGVGRSLGLLPGRVTFVIDPGGTIRKVFSSQFRPRRHIDEALAAIRSGS